MAKAKTLRSNVKDTYIRCEACNGLKVILVDAQKEQYVQCWTCQGQGIRLFQREITHLNVPVTPVTK